MSQASVLLGGSRKLSGGFRGLVAAVALAVHRSGCLVRVGCAPGADAAVVSSLLSFPASLSVFAVGGSSGSGFPSRSFFQSASSAAAAGCSVSWWAGGSSSVPLRARLAIRSRVAGAGCSSAVFFLSSAGSRGSLLAASHLAKAGRSVFVFACGFSGSPAPLPGCSGTWVHVFPGSWFSPFVAQFSVPCFFWQPAVGQLPLL